MREGKVGLRVSADGHWEDRLSPYRKMEGWDCGWRSVVSGGNELLAPVLNIPSSPIGGK